jgi:hypothetical protein
MARIQPVLVVSRDLHLQDNYVLMLRKRRIPALGVDTCGDVIEMRRHIKLAAIVVDVVSVEDLSACRLIRGACDAAVIAVTRLDGADTAATKHASGCAAAVAARRGSREIARTVARVLARRPDPRPTAADSRGLGPEHRLLGGGDLHPQPHRFDVADEQKDECGDEVADGERLVVNRGEPAPEGMS